MVEVSKELNDVLQREAVCRSVLFQKPMAFPDFDAKMYVDLTVNQQQTKQQTPPELIAYVYDQIVGRCAADSGEDQKQFEAYMKGLNEIWPALKVKMEMSYGLAEYMRVIGAHSLFLPRYYATLYHPMSLEAPFAMAVRIDGKYMAVPTYDTAYALCVREPIFRTAVMRTAEEQLLMMELGDGLKKVSLGCAMLPEHNHFAWQKRGIKQQVVAYDNVPRLMECLEQVYTDEVLKKFDIRNQDYWEAFKDPDLQKEIDLVSMEGGLSYAMDQIDDLLSGVAGLLRSGGYFCGELELRHLYTIRCGCLGWKMDKTMQFGETVDSSVAWMEVAAQKAGMKIVKVRPDTLNLQPAAVWFALQKI